MLKIIFILSFLLTGMFGFAQSNQTTSKDSCQILKEVLTTNWHYKKKENYFIESSDIVTKIKNYPAFINCLKGKSKKEIKNLFHAPSKIYNIDKDEKQFVYYIGPNLHLNPNNKKESVCCAAYFILYFDKSWNVIKVETTYGIQPHFI